MDRVASFDVFDTLMTRTIGGPDEVFAVTGRLLQDRGTVDVPPAVFAAARRAAQRVLTVDPDVHPSLATIAAEVAARLGLRETMTAVLVETEVEVERSVCRAVPGAIQRVAAARSETGRGVVFVSDTPLSGGALEEVLVREGLFRTGDRLFTSADVGASKQGGGLYGRVQGAVGASPGQFTHVGDDQWSDVVHARVAGWRATADGRGRFTGREQPLDRSGSPTDGLGPRLAAASRTARLLADVHEVDPVIASIAGAVGSPLMTGFSLWVLQRARSLGLDRLYFVARDGEVLLETARALARAGGFSVECRYLHGSRRVWQWASAGRAGHDPLADLWIPDGFAPSELSPRALLALLDLVPDDLAAAAPSTALDPECVDRPIGAVGWSELRAELESPALRAEVRRRAVDRRDLLLEHLDQEGVTGPGRVGLVDVGWTGRASRCLEDVLVDAGRPVPAAHMFIGLVGSAPERMGPELYGRSRGWLIDEGRGRSRPAGVQDPVKILETFTMGREGTTIGFAREAGRVVPLLAAPVNPASRSWAMDDYRQALAWSVEAFVDGLPAHWDRFADLRPVVWRQLLDFWRRPSAEEARAWGSQHYGDDWSNSLSHPLATPLTVRRLLTRAGLGLPTWREPTYWLEGSVRVSPSLLRMPLLLAVLGQRRWARVRRIPRRVRNEIVLRRSH